MSSLPPQYSFTYGSHTGDPSFSLPPIHPRPAAAPTPFLSGSMSVGSHRDDVSRQSLAPSRVRTPPRDYSPRQSPPLSHQTVFGTGYQGYRSPSTSPRLTPPPGPSRGTAFQSSYPASRRPASTDRSETSPPFAGASSQSAPQPPVILSPLFVDTLAHDYQLEPEQRFNLHAFVKLGSVGESLSQADLATRTYHLAAIFHDIADCHRQEAKDNSLGSVVEMFNDLKIRLGDDNTNVLISAQRTNIRHIAQDVIYQADRTVFGCMNIDVLRICREEMATLNFTNIFGNPAREKALVSTIKKICSSVRNALRQDIRNSIVGANRCSLAEFTYQSALKYKRGGPGERLEMGYTVHNVILRRFGLDHPDLIGIYEAEESQDEDDSPEPPSKKRKTRAGGRVAKGKDFWGQVDTWFLKEVSIRGKKLTSLHWQEYVDDCIARDNAQFAIPGPNAATSHAVGGRTVAIAAQVPAATLSRPGQGRDMTALLFAA